MIVPKAGESVECTGSPKLVWFRALKNSDRICNRRVSAHLNDRESPKSILLAPGPRRMFRPASPYACGEGITKADVLNHSAIERWSDGSAPFPTTLGRQLFPWALIVAQGIRTLNGDPVWAVTTPLSCHPPRIARLNSEIPGDRDLPHQAGDKTMRPVKTRQATIQSGISWVLRVLAARRGVVGSVALIVDRFRPRIRSQEIQPVREPLFDFRL